MTEIALQGESKGILYEGYTKAFKQCVFEEGDVEGKNERYEFRCDYDLQCCGRHCCIPEEATIPLWLMILFIFLALLLLLAILGTLAYLCAKRRKPKPKKDFGKVDTTKNGYSALTDGKNSNLLHEHETYSTPDHLYGGYGDRTYSSGRGGTGRGYGNSAYASNGIEGREVAVPVRTQRDYMVRDYAPPRRDSRATVSSDGHSLVRHGMHETIEESYKSEVTYERPASTDSREML